jgi:hypothetical protein
MCWDNWKKNNLETIYKKFPAMDSLQKENLESILFSAFHHNNIKDNQINDEELEDLIEKSWNNVSNRVERMKSPKQMKITLKRLKESPQWKGQKYKSAWQFLKKIY